MKKQRLKIIPIECDHPKGPKNNKQGMCCACYQKARWQQQPPAVCHPDRKNHAGGYCRNCYRGGKQTRKAECHPDQIEYADKICRKCYFDRPAIKEGQKRSSRKLKYGLSEEQFKKMEEDQQGICIICKQGPAEAIDHCHNTGKVRGLLCDPCNIGLGGFKDDINRLQAAIEYIKVSNCCPLERTGDYISTYSGQRLYLLDPRPTDINIKDIAHSLSLSNRFCGHSLFSYSVALHCINVSTMLEEMKESKLVQLWGLLHDAEEAFVNDLPSPLKRCPELAGYREIGKNVQKAICKKFNLPWPEPAVVKEVDCRMLATEAKKLIKNFSEWDYPHLPYDSVEIRCLEPKEVEEAFLKRFKLLNYSNQPRYEYQNNI